MDRQSILIAGGRERPYSSETEFAEGVGLVAVRGTMDLSTAPQLKRDIGRAMESASGDLILDLSDLDMIDSTALCVMAGALQHLQGEGRRLVLVITRPYVLRIFAITGLQTAFTIVGSRREALQRVLARAADLAFAGSPRGPALRGAVT